MRWFGTTLERGWRGLTYANAVATLALFSALSGGAYAAKQLTGASFKDGSLAELDFKSGSLGLSELSATAKKGFVGPKGDRGLGGSTGDIGQSGAQGPTGSPGEPAKLTSTWAWHATGLTTDTTERYNTPNPTSVDWDSATYGTGNDDPDPGDAPYLNIRSQTSSTPVNMTSSWQMVVALNGMTGGGTNETVGTQGQLVLPWPAHVTATATLTFLHRRDGENLDAYSAPTGTNRHVRLLCKIAYGSGTNYGSFTTMGIPVYVSSSVAHELVDAQLVADVDTTASLVPAGTYNLAVLCRDIDMTPTASTVQWSLASANVSVVGSAP